MSDPILTPSSDRFCTFPIRYPKLWELYQKAQASFWVAAELDLSADASDFAKLTHDEQHFISHILAFFASSDGLVSENLAARFLKETQLPEARSFYAFQIAMESVHGETYSLLIDTLVKDPVAKNHLFRAISTIPCIAKKAQWALKWLDSALPFSDRLIAFACIEGIQFSGAFCSIFYMKKRNLLPGLCTSNEFISRDEGLHRDFACMLHDHLTEKASPDTIIRIVTEAVELEKEFVCDALPCALIGMNSDAMSRYIEFVGDHLLLTLGLSKHYGTPNPFPFMENLSLQNKQNFFETRVSTYQKAGVLDGGQDRVFTQDEDF